MSTLWTPSGEHPIRRSQAEEEADPDGSQPRPGWSGPGGGPSDGPGGRGGGGRPRPGRGAEPTPEEARAAKEELDAIREQLAQAPAELVIANHAMGLWEAAALHLSHKPPQLPQAQLAIDALTALLDGMQGRLGDDEKSLSDGLAEIRMAFVQIHNAERARQASASSGN